MALSSPRAFVPPTRNSLWTLPNILSLLRVAFVPFFLWAMIRHQTLAALILFAAAGLTDFLDGLAARRLNLRSALGEILDPAADKILMTAAYVACALPSLSKPNALPLALVILVVGRDAAIALGALTLRRLRSKTSFKPSLWGKISTVLQIGLVVMILFFNALKVRPDALLTALIALTLAATLLSGGHYFWKVFMGGLSRRGRLDGA
jgi:cardiolipin synthase